MRSARRHAAVRSEARRDWRGAAALLLLAAALAFLGLPVRPAPAAVAYQATIAGTRDRGLADLLTDASQLKSLEGVKPATLDALRRRAARDLPRLIAAAHSLGYWQARISYRIDAKAKPVKVTVSVKQGPLYHVASVAVLGPDGKPLAVPRPKDAPPLPLRPGEPAKTAPVIAAERDLIAVFKNAGHPFAKAVGRRVVIDRGTKTMAVAYRLQPGPRLRFGPTDISGLVSLNPAFVRARLKWRAGQRFDERKVAATRQALINSGLFSTVTLTPAPDSADPRLVVMRLAVSERAHHTIGVGAAYNTTEGAGVRAFWENRNLFGNAENLRLEIGAGQQADYARANFRRPDFFAPDQDLLALAEFDDATPIAYHSRRIVLSTGVQRRLGPHLDGGLSLAFEKANVLQFADVGLFSANQRTQHYTLASLPLRLHYDDTDNLFNPTRGWRFWLNLAPYQSVTGPNLSFATERIAASTYRRLFGSDRYVFAVFGAFTSLQGPALGYIPADKRIYAGGGGSVRAYGYEMAGPLDSSHRPIGGKSAIELSLEARIRITPTIGIVPFIDAGSYYETSLPHPFSRRLLWGPGIGLRYYTPFGPIRFDIATPLDRRPGDSLVQIYISLGQAF